MKSNASAQARGVAVLGTSAIVLRVFVLLAIDEGACCSGAWIGAALGGVLSLPALLMTSSGRIRGWQGGAPRKGRVSERAACALLAAMMIYDAAVSARLFAAIIGYGALNGRSVPALCLPAFAAVLPVCLMGTGALCASAVVWRRAALALGLLAALIQAREMEPGWLFPLFGEGFPEIAWGAFSAAGFISAAALGMRALADGHMTRLAASAFRAALACTAVLLLAGMLLPPMPGAQGDRLFRIALLADSGRNGFAAEIIFVLLVSGGLLLVGFELMTAAVSLNASAPGLPLAACAALACGLAAALAITGASGAEQALKAVRWYYPVSLAAAALRANPDGRRNER